jgi:RHS repeat-associated protein
LTGITTKLNNVTTETYTYTYDSNGNQKTITRTPYSGGVPQTAQTTSNNYDIFNQLTSTTLPNGTSVQYGYNAEGLRVNKTVGGVLTRYLYEYDKVILELDSAGAQKARNIYGTNLISRTVGSQTLNYMYNGHGDVTALFDATAVSNIARSKTVTGSVTVTSAAYATDGTVNTSQYTSIGSNSQWAKVDFGQSQYIDKVKLWRYFGDTRKYKDVVIQFSNDANFANGVTTVFNNDTDNSAGQGTGTDTEYTETNQGKTITFRPIYARYIRLWSNGNTVTANNHIVELEVYKSSVVGTYYYDAFGNITEQVGSVDNNITYAGYQYDKETGLYYLNARMYDPKIARFMQEDTYTGDPNDPLSLNLYTYCHNEPMMYNDPTGHVNVCVNNGSYTYFLGTNIGATIENDYTIVNFKAFVEGLGGAVTWEPAGKDRIATATGNYTYYNEYAHVDQHYSIAYKSGPNSGETKYFQIKDSTLRVRLRDVADAFGFSYEFKEGTVTLSRYKPTNNVNNNNTPVTPVTPQAPQTPQTSTPTSTPTPTPTPNQSNANNGPCYKQGDDNTISIPSYLYNYNQDSKYSISVQMKLAELTIEWYKANEDERKLISYLIILTREDAENDLIGKTAVRFVENALNSLFGEGLLTEATFQFLDISDMELSYLFEQIYEQELTYIAGTVFKLPNVVRAAGGVEGNFSLKDYTYRIDTNKVAPGEGGFHIHVYQGDKEIAKVNGRGGFVEMHSKEILLKPSELKKSVRNELNKLIKYTKGKINIKR